LLFGQLFSVQVSAVHSPVSRLHLGQQSPHCPLQGTRLVCGSPSGIIVDPAGRVLVLGTRPTGY
jgi:hypothetical protein